MNTSSSNTVPLSNYCPCSCKGYPLIHFVHIVSCESHYVPVVCLLCSCCVPAVFLLLQDHVRDANLSMLLQTVYPPDLLEAHEMFQDALKVW